MMKYILIIALAIYFLISLGSDGCGNSPDMPAKAPTADFSVTLSESSCSIYQGESSDFAIIMNRSENYAEPILVEAINPVIGTGEDKIEAVFDPNPVTGDTTLLYLIVGYEVPEGTYEIVIKGSASLERTTQLSITVLKRTNPWKKNHLNVWPLLAIHFSDINNCIAVGEFGTVIKTSDGGINWTELDANTSEILTAVRMLNNTTGYISGTNNTCLFTSNGGVTWSDAWGIDSITTSFSSLYFSSLLNGWLIGNEIYYTSNGGNTWNVQLPYLGGGAGWTDIAFGTTLNGVVVGYKSAADGQIRYTDNGGLDWNESNFPVFREQINSVCFADAATVYASGETRILKSTDAGHNWMELNTSFTNNLTGISFADANTGLVVCFEKIYLTTNGGVNWQLEYSGTGENLNNVVFVNMQTAYAVGGFANSAVIIRRN